MSDCDDELPEWVKPGATFRYDFGRQNRHHGRVFHVRAIVDGMAVIREWRKSKRAWQYTVEPPEYFDAYDRHIKTKPPGD